MLIENLWDLPQEMGRAIIINANTKLVTTLSLLSAIRYAKMPVLLIECCSNDGSFEHFLELMKKYEFDMITAPLQIHGVTLDWLFRNTTAKKILLVDSDLEIKSSAIIRFYKQYIDEFNVFGCGFTNGPAWLIQKPYQGTYLEGALFLERPWLPLTFLNVTPVRNAIAAGKSFINFDQDNEYSLLQPLASFRTKHPLIKKILKHGPSWLRKTIHGMRPAMICYDTGTQIFEYLKYEKLMSFVGLPEAAYRRFVAHYQGVTRNTLDPTDTLGCGGLKMISDEVRKRLYDVYGEVVQ